jgi:hypothetical protein
MPVVIDGHHIEDVTLNHARVSATLPLLGRFYKSRLGRRRSLRSKLICVIAYTGGASHSALLT